jgi:hypothetical protein
MWRDSLTILIYPSDNSLEVNSEIKVHQNSNIRSVCLVSNTRICSLIETLKPTTLIVSSPVNIIQPVASVSAPAVISRCASLFLDISGMLNNL